MVRQLALHVIVLLNCSKNSRLPASLGRSRLGPQYTFVLAQSLGACGRPDGGNSYCCISSRHLPRSEDPALVSVENS